MFKKNFLSSRLQFRTTCVHILSLSYALKFFTYFDNKNIKTKKCPTCQLRKPWLKCFQGHWTLWRLSESEDVFVIIILKNGQFLFRPQHHKSSLLTKNWQSDHLRTVQWFTWIYFITIKLKFGKIFVALLHKAMPKLIDCA